MDRDQRDMEAFLNAKFRFWQCPVKGHRYRSDRDGVPLATVEWDGDVAGCLAHGCGRISTDPVPRGDCWCDGYTNGWATTECTGECCGPGQCSCTPDQSGGDTVGSLRATLAGAGANDWQGWDEGAAGGDAR